MDFYINRTKIGKTIEFESKPVMNKHFPTIEEIVKPIQITCKSDIELIKTGNEILDVILDDQRKKEKEILDSIYKELEDGTRIFHHFYLYKCENCGSYYIMWLEKGLEDEFSCRMYDEFKPVPYIISCPNCGANGVHHTMYGLSERIFGTNAIYHHWVSGMNVFVNIDESEFGYPIIFSPDSYVPDLVALIDRSIRMCYDCEFKKTIFSNVYGWLLNYIREDMGSNQELVNKKLNRRERRHNEKFENTRYKRTRKGDKNFF